MRIALSHGPALGLALLVALTPGSPAQQAEPRKTPILHILDHPDDTSACEGGTATFEVTASPAATTYQWRKDGNPLTGETAPTLAISPVSPADAGSYDVVVTFRGRSATSDAADLTVNERPTITTHPMSQTAVIGSSVTLSVAASGDGPFTYQWRKRQGVFGSFFAPIPGQTGSTLTINPVKASSSGTYDCVVSNACGGTASNAANLSVAFQ